MTLDFVVFGVAVPKGSTRAFTPKGARFPIVTADNAKTKPWQALVADRASAALEASGGAQFEGAVALAVTFWLPRPASLPRRVREHLKKPDLDKLVRSVKDALTRVVWPDDAQVVHVNATKRYAEAGTAPHAEIRISHWTEERLALAPSA
jgi:Holliday junction resolvase RusA-like endonuclease